MIDYPGRKLGQIAFALSPLLSYIAAIMGLVAYRKSKKSGVQNRRALFAAIIGCGMTIVSLPFYVGSSGYDPSVSVVFVGVGYIVVLSLLPFSGVKYLTDSSDSSEPEFLDVAPEQINNVGRALLNEESRGKALVLYRRLARLVSETKGPQAVDELNKYLVSQGFSFDYISSPQIGHISSTKGHWIEFFEDYVIYNEQSQDYNPLTKIDYLTDGSLDQRVVPRGNGFVHESYDSRRAAIQITDGKERIYVEVNPSGGLEAKALISQIQARITVLSPKSISSQDIHQLVSAIIDSSSQTNSQKIEDLDKLRYKRLLSDDDYKLAVKKILDL